MSREDIYGFLQDDLLGIGKQIEEIFDVTFQLHDSLYRGGDYLNAKTRSGEELILQQNFNSLWSEFAEPEYDMFPLILYVGDSKRITEYTERLEKMLGDQVTHLSTREYKKPNS